MGLELGSLSFHCHLLGQQVSCGEQPMVFLEPDILDSFLSLVWGPYDEKVSKVGPIRLHPPHFLPSSPLAWAQANRKIH